MAKFKKPPRDKFGKFSKFQQRSRSFGTRPGGTTKPEARPVKPKTPGTKDRPRRRRLTTDPSILRGKQRRS